MSLIQVSHVLNYQQVCKNILKLDDLIRFVGVATLEAEIVAEEYRKGIEPLLTKEELQLSIMQSLMRDATRRTLEQKLGRTVYATAVYEKVNRATITIFDKRTGKTSALLMLSIEKEANLDAVITEKILPFLEGKEFEAS
jgi:hypothetical protein